MRGAVLETDDAPRSGLVFRSLTLAVLCGAGLLPGHATMAQQQYPAAPPTDAGPAAPRQAARTVVVALPDPGGEPGSVEELTDQFDDAGAARAGNRGNEWIVAPIPFRSALLGYGLKLGVARLKAAEYTGEQRRVAGTGVGGMYAENGSYAVAGGNRHYWRDGRVRTTVGMAGGEFNYDLQLGEALGSKTLPVTQRAAGAMLDVEWNVSRHAWVGGGLRYARSPVTIAGLPPAVVDLLPDATFRLASIALKGQWDTRDDEFYPLAGTLSKAGADFTRSDNGLRTDDFARYSASYNGYHSVGDRGVVAWRAAAETVSGAAPFFALPWYGSGVDLRGYTPGRYIGESLVAAQAEFRWQATFRVGLVAFGGVGTVRNPPPGFDEADWLPAGGVGLRWRLAQQNRLNFRIDYARGRDDDSLIISVGEAF
jgi:hypothetical protein